MNFCAEHLLSFYICFLLFPNLSKCSTASGSNYLGKESNLAYKHVVHRGYVNIFRQH